MKKIILILALLSIGSLTLMAQPPSPPATGNNGGTNGIVGGGAPIGNGTFILLALASFYIWRKVYVIQCDNEQE